MDFKNEILPSCLCDDTLSSSEIADLIQKMKQMKIIKDKYRDKIKARKDGNRFYVIINRKQVTALSVNDLYDKLWELEFGRMNASLEMLYPEWLKWKRDEFATKAKTLREYTFIWKKHLQDQQITKIPVKDLMPKDFLVFFRQITKDRTLTSKAFQNMKSLLNGIFDYAIEEEIVSHNPILDVNCRRLTFKPVNNGNKAFTIEERKLLLDHLKDNDSIYSLAVQLDFCLILRIGELLALKWSDIEGDFIRVQGQHLPDTTMDDDLTFSERFYVNTDCVKGNTDMGYRNEFLTAKAKNILERIKKINPDGEFIFMRNGKQLYADTFNEYLKRYCAEIGIAPRSSHKIRFTTASILASEGVDLTEIQKMLGHTTLAMTLKYLKNVNSPQKTTSIMESALG